MSRRYNWKTPYLYMVSTALFQLLLLRLLLVSTSSIVADFGQPRDHGKSAHRGASWSSSWETYLHHQVDQLLLALKEPSVVSKHGDTSHLKPNGSHGDEAFQIAFVGDSTMLMQFNVLGALLLGRASENGRSECTTITSNEIHCTAETGVNTAVLAIIKMYKAYLYIPKDIDADIVYFGSGLHLLQMAPYRLSSSREMDMWVRYDELMEDAVHHFRKKGGKRRVPMEVVFMTTHSISIDLFVDDYAVGAPNCGHSDMLAACLLWVSSSRRWIEDCLSFWCNVFSLSPLWPAGNSLVIELSLRDRLVSNGATYYEGRNCHAL